MSSAYRRDTLYLSPHLDDAVFSCGGQIFAQAEAGRRVAVLTVAGGDPPPGDPSPLVRDLHRRWGLADGAVEARREEDRAACRLLGAECEQWPVPDALYCRDPDTGLPLYPSLAALFRGLHPRDCVLIAELADRLRALPRAARVHAPLAAGRHVDHLLVRGAAEAAFGADLAYYEDFPYSRNRWVLRKALGFGRRWRSEVVALGAEALAAKCRAIACYRSQLPTAFADLEDLRRQVGRAAARAGGERLWRRRLAAPAPGR